MGDYELKQPAAQAVCLRETEETTQVNSVDHQHIDHGQPEDDAKGKRQHRDADVVGHDLAGDQCALSWRNLSPQLVVLHTIDDTLWNSKAGLKTYAQAVADTRDCTDVNSRY